MIDAEKQPRRIRFAGFICGWRLPHPAGESPKERFVSDAESVQASLQSHLEAVEPGKWKAIRIAAPEKYFLGFARR
jgi:hypothetical protein